ncbi:MAG: peptide chain release factor N(5)-glutamine methyltransferase [Ghiorsea sp.]
MKVRQLLQETIPKLQQAGCDSPRRDAELLLMYTWGISDTELIIKMMDEVPEEFALGFDSHLQRRLAREPIAYILGYKEFWSRDFVVTPDVLVPRPETEHLIESVLKYFPNQHKDYNFVDIGTGSGCIGVTLALEYPRAHVIACDISEKSLHIARKNAERLGVANRMQFCVGDLYGALPSGSSCELIVSNPPYVSVDEMLGLEPELTCEPRHALTDESSGLTLLDKLLNQAHNHLKDEGMLMLESGLCGMPACPQTMIKLEDYNDLAGNFRGSIFRKV